MKISNIIKGWTNYAFKNNEMEKEAIRKAKICASNECGHYEITKYLSWVGDDIKELEGSYCNKCHCPLSSKLRSDDPCPIGRF